MYATGTNNVMAMESKQKGRKSAVPIGIKTIKKVWTGREKYELAHSRRSRNKKGNWNCAIKVYLLTVEYLT